MVLFNILQNALKYTLKGKIIIKAKQVENDKVKISVKDTGIGISEYKQKQVMNFGWALDFDQNYRQINRSEGLGLRLFVTKKICKFLADSNENSLILKS